MLSPLFWGCLGGRLASGEAPQDTGAQPGTWTPGLPASCRTDVLLQGPGCPSSTSSLRSELTS